MYKGQVKDKTLVRHGQGTYTYPNKYFTYKGSWDEGIKHGKGLFTLGDGSSYEGDFYDGEITGRGLRRWPDGSTYSGQFKFGEMEGCGIYVSANGEKYDGDMVANVRQGDGEMTFPSGDVYQGKFDANKPHGEGTEYMANGRVYQGNMVRGVRQGVGELLYLAGQSYSGQWVNGGQHGEGTFTDKGYRYSGKWENGAPNDVAKHVVLVNTEQLLEKNENTGAYCLNLNAGEELPSLTFLFTTSTLDEMAGREAGEDENGEPVEAVEPVTPVPASCESGRVLKLSAFRAITSEEGEILRSPACVLASATEMAEMLDSGESSSKISEGSKTNVAEDGETPIPSIDETNPTIVDMAPTISAAPVERKEGEDGQKEESPEVATASLQGFSVRPDVVEGTYEFVVTDATPLDKNESVGLCGLVNSVRFEITINPGNAKGGKKKKKK